jgi:DNA-binding MarR family transcriptional regulator
VNAGRSHKGQSEGVLASNIGYHIARAQVTTMRLFAQHIGEPLALRPVEYSLLMLLLANDELTPKQLTQALTLPAPSLTMLLDRLHERGLVERVRSETDRRSQRVLLTEAGRALATAAGQRSPHMNAALDRALSQGEQMMLTELLRKVAALPRDA